MAFFPFKCHVCNVGWRVPVPERDAGDPWPLSHCWNCGRFGKRGAMGGFVNKFVHEFD